MLARGSSGSSFLMSCTESLWQTRTASCVSTTTRSLRPQRAITRPLLTAIVLLVPTDTTDPRHTLPDGSEEWCLGSAVHEPTSSQSKSAKMVATDEAFSRTA